MTIAFAQFGRIYAVLGAGRYADAWPLAQCLSDPASAARHRVISCWLIGDLAEAALRTDQADQARAFVTQVQAASGYVPPVTS